jgi:dUTP pyrophosphatase
MSEQITLFIKPMSEEFAELYCSWARDYNNTEPVARNSGFDLFCDGADGRNPQLSDTTVLVGQGCYAAAVDGLGRPRAFWLAPRSSISKTPWRLANSLGLIDATYRGIIYAALTSQSSILVPPHQQRLCQLARPDLLPWDAVVVLGAGEELPGGTTARGAGGFGSTGSGSGVQSAAS